jgi:hypothetical protein
VDDTGDGGAAAFNLGADNAGLADDDVAFGGQLAFDLAVDPDGSAGVDITLDLSS